MIRHARRMISREGGQPTDYAGDGKTHRIRCSGVNITVSPGVRSSKQILEQWVKARDN